ncbi:hypothetical protein [Azovibrio restrictus]|uniref:hypothetical protein n=1 Tax=Azovibrio restrictus TaxID=146938 RepID=UPI00041D9820|nr:hypothetical protein [Azovibrio restrictus]MCE1171797.1 hypothetical protein [Azovibrio sp.]MDD3484695.1 hypothetical protein [Azovibrio restrictus]
MMQQLQNWFDRMVGVASLEREMHRQAREIYRARELPAEIHLPACWRRLPRVGQRIQAG